MSLPEGNRLFMAASSDEARAEAMRAMNRQGSLSEQRFNQIALLAQSVSGSPVAMVLFADDARLWFQGSVGAVDRASHGHSAFFLEALNEDRVLWVEDARLDPRFDENPLVVGRPWIRFCGSAPIRLESGEAIGVVAVVSDEPRAFDAAVARQLRTLADIAGDECAHRISLAQLTTARREAEAAQQVKAAFLTNMNHELRTPLNGVVAAAEMLLAEPLNVAQRELVQIVTASARNLCGLVDDVLALSSQVADGPASRAVAFNAADVCRQAMALYEGAAKSKGLEVIVDLAKVDRDFLGAPAGLRQILRALVSNAVKFTNAGHIRLSASVRRAGKQQLVDFVVEDTGVGFEPDVQARLFKPFEMGDDSLTRSHGGVGAGLAIAHALADRLGGRLDVKSAPGQGSSFRLSLRLAPAPAKAKAMVATVGRCGRRPPRILAAEDHPTNRRVLELILEAAGIEAQFVENGALAVEASRCAPYDLILMDMQMPVMDGLTAIEHIRRREMEGGAGITPICTLTAHAMPEHEDAALEAGAQAHLTKPIAAAELLECIAGLTGWTP